MNGVLITPDSRDRYEEVYKLPDETWGGRMTNLVSHNIFPWFKGHEPLYCTGENGSKLFFELGGTKVSGEIYERVMLSQNVEFLKRLPKIYRDTFFMACEAYPPLSGIFLDTKNQTEDPKLTSMLGYVPARDSRGLGVIMDNAICDVALIMKKVESLGIVRPHLLPFFNSFFHDVAESLFNKYPELSGVVAFAHELGHIKQIIDEYSGNIRNFMRVRNEELIQNVGYSLLSEAINAGVTGDKLVEVEIKYRSSSFERYADDFAHTLFTDNIGYFSRYMRDSHIV